MPPSLKILFFIVFSNFSAPMQKSTRRRKLYLQSLRFTVLLYCFNENQFRKKGKIHYFQNQCWIPFRTYNGSEANFFRHFCAFKILTYYACVDLGKNLPCYFGGFLRRTLVNILVKSCRDSWLSMFSGCVYKLSPVSKS